MNLQNNIKATESAAQPSEPTACILHWHEARQSPWVSPPEQFLSARESNQSSWKILSLYDFQPLSLYHHHFKRWHPALGDRVIQIKYEKRSPGKLQRVQAVPLASQHPWHEEIVDGPRYKPGKQLIWIVQLSVFKTCFIMFAWYKYIYNFTYLLPVSHCNPNSENVQSTSHTAAMWALSQPKWHVAAKVESHRRPFALATVDRVHPGGVLGMQHNPPLTVHYIYGLVNDWMLQWLIAIPAWVDLGIVVSPLFIY